MFFIISSEEMMKNIFALLLATGLLALTLGCGLISRVQDETTGVSDSNRTLSDKAVDATVGDTKVGIKECDDALEMLNEQINDPEESFVTKAVKRTVLNQFREQLKRSLEENNADKKEVADFCSEFRKSMIEQQAADANSAKQ